MTTDLAKKLAAALRDATENSKWQDALLGIADDLEGKYDEPAEHWHGPFEWRGGECPLPPETQVKAEGRDSDFNGGGTRPAFAHFWDHSGGMADIVAFSYLADNPEGWVERPEGWVPPASVFPIEALGLSGQLYELLSPADLDGELVITHIRLLPREAELKPAPSDVLRDALVAGSVVVHEGEFAADVQATVREALEAADSFMRFKYDLEEMPTYPRKVFGQIRKALATLETSPAETVVGYASIKSRIELRPTIWSHAKDCRNANPSSRIVKVVEVHNNG